MVAVHVHPSVVVLSTQLVLAKPRPPPKGMLMPSQVVTVPEISLQLAGSSIVSVPVTCVSSV